MNIGYVHTICPCESESGSDQADPDTSQSSPVYLTSVKKAHSISSMRAKIKLTAASAQIIPVAKRLTVLPLMP